MIVDIIFVGLFRDQMKKYRYIRKNNDMIGVNFFYTFVEVPENPTEEERTQVVNEVIDLVQNYKNKTHVVVLGLDDLVRKLKNHQEEHAYTVELMST